MKPRVPILLLAAMLVSSSLFAQTSVTEDDIDLAGIWNQGTPPPLEFTRPASVAAAPTSPPAAPVAAAPTGQNPPPAGPAAPAKNPFGIPFEMAVPVPPTPFPSGGKTHLVYELDLTNFAPSDELITKLEVLNGTTALAAYEGAELESMLWLAGVPKAADKRAIGPGQRAIAFLWIALDAGMPVPTSLRHRITADDQTLEGATVAVRTEKPLVLGPPLRGADWVAGNGPSNASVHRRVLIALNGVLHIAQRFAIDWVQVGADRKTFDGDQKDNTSYRAYGHEILAVADGAVVSTTDGIPENIPGSTSRAVAITPETIGGNNVILDLGDGHFAFYAHIQPGSLRVKVGDKVRRGQTLGLVGNSGNSTEPHLHFHVSDGPLALQSEGLPYVLESFEVQTALNTWEPRQNELPLENTHVRFPAVK